jgi:phosphoribosyl-ATP pyrophosphohydrolase
MALQQVHPLIIRRQDGEIIDVSLMNEKSYTKSVERGELWHLNRDTGRVLPFDERLRMLSLKGQPNWYEAVVQKEDASDQDEGRAHAGEDAAVSERIYEEPAALRYGSPAGGRTEEARPAGAAGPGGAGTAAQTPGCGAALELLEQTILARKATLPQGSYTTHLFTSGEEKIRKKTGEEAVELLLAREEERIVSESADLIYHLLVLLAHYNIPVSAVCGELSRRGGGESGGES